MDFIPTTIKPYLNFIHPPLMWVLFATCLYAFYLGWQVRKTRSATGDEKKALIKGKFIDRHYQIGSIILAVMVLGSIGGMTVTYINNGKLFVGPHLIAGLAMTGLIAVSASFLPSCKKVKIGQDTVTLASIQLLSVYSVGKHSLV